MRVCILDLSHQILTSNLGMYHVQVEQLIGTARADLHVRGAAGIGHAARHTQRDQTICWLRRATRTCYEMVSELKQYCRSCAQISADLVRGRKCGGDDQAGHSNQMGQSRRVFTRCRTVIVGRSHLQHCRSLQARFQDVSGEGAGSICLSLDTGLSAGPCMRLDTS